MPEIINGVPSAADVERHITTDEAATSLNTTHRGSTGSDHSLAADAIHDNVAAEINAIAEKGTPVNADLVVIEDSADSNKKKKAQVGNLPAAAGAGGGVTHLFNYFYDSSDQGTWATNVLDACIFNSYTINDASHNDGDDLHFSVYLGAGTYTFKLQYLRDDNRGIVDVYIDAVEVASFDMYGTSNNNLVGTQTEIVVASSGVKDIKLIIDGKNGSSSDHTFGFQNACFYRTA